MYAISRCTVGSLSRNLYQSVYISNEIFANNIFANKRKSVIISSSFGEWKWIIIIIFFIFDYLHGKKGRVFAREMNRSTIAKQHAVVAFSFGNRIYGDELRSNARYYYLMWLQSHFGMFDISWKLLVEEIGIWTSMKSFSTVYICMFWGEWERERKRVKMSGRPKRQQQPAHQIWCIAFCLAFRKFWMTAKEIAFSVLVYPRWFDCVFFHSHSPQKNKNTTSAVWI